MSDTNLPDTSNLPEFDLKNYRLTPKYQRWSQLYLDQTNAETFGNALKSALIAYNLDPVTQYATAGQIGYENLKKLEDIRSITRRYLDDNGFTLPVLLNHALTKMADPTVKTDRWWTNLMKVTGYMDERPQVNVQNNTQINHNTVQVTKEEAEQFNKDFEEFLEKKYSTPSAPTPNPASQHSE
jgi:hypothetical protein